HGLLAADEPGGGSRAKGRGGAWTRIRGLATKEGAALRAPGGERGKQGPVTAAMDPATWFVGRSGHADPPAGEGSSAARIFCFPHAGGSSRAFLDWQADLGDDAEVLAICRPGRDHRADEPAPTIGQLIDGAAAAIAAVAQDGTPSYLFGHSLGTLV